MRWLWIALAAAGLVVLCCCGVLLHRFILNWPWRVTVFEAEVPRIPGPIEIREDHDGNSMMMSQYEDGTIASLTIRRFPRLLLLSPV